MGCGQSKIHLYPRKSKSKANGKKGHADSDAETDEDEGGHIGDTEKNQNRERTEKSDINDQSNKDTQETEDDVSVSLLRSKNLSLLQSQEISTSQQNFFRMLDKKIEEGPDYDSASETEIALEEARLNALVQHWESASLTASICSSASRSLQTTPVRQGPVKQLTAASTIIPSSMPQGMSADFLPHGSPQSQAQLPAGPMKHPQNQQQIVISHMNTKLMHPMAMVPQMSMGMPSSDTTAITPNTSTSLSLLQASATNQQFTHFLALPTGTGSSQLLGKQQNLSPKRVVDPRLMINQTPHGIQQQQQQPPLQPPQYIATTTLSSTPSNFVNGVGRATVQQKQNYFGQANVQQQNTTQLTSQHEQFQQGQIQSNQFYTDVIHSVQVPTEYRFPPAISVQRLAPQVQRQLRETQELIKDSCPQLYAAGYGSPGPPIRSQARNSTNRRPTLETQFSQELS